MYEYDKWTHGEAFFMMKYWNSLHGSLLLVIIIETNWNYYWKLPVLLSLVLKKIRLHKVRASQLCFADF